jgi:cobyrinic acid a,c-diamide synthase
LTPEGLVLAGMQSSSGKTAVTCMLLAALRERGLAPQPFKAGPDYIDPAYHQRFAGRPSINLDAWMMGHAEVQRLAQSYGKGRCNLLEGVMGLFDGSDPQSHAGSTLEIAQWLGWPIVLIVPCAKAGRSLKAAIRGFLLDAKPAQIVGLILNQVNGAAHAEYLGRAFAELELPILGVVPQLAELEWPERHLGLTASAELELSSVQRFAALGEEHLQVEALLQLQLTSQETSAAEAPSPHPRLRIAVAQDEAFHFYYHENLEWLRRRGAELVAFSPLHDPALPLATDGVILGGGFPELFAAEIASNKNLLKSLHDFIERGGACYAECGGLMLLAERLRLLDGTEYEMAGVVPESVEMTERLQHFGYSQVSAPDGSVLRGHEFHHSRWLGEDQHANLWNVQKVSRKASRREGFRYRNLHASYVHLYFPQASNLFDNLFFQQTT